ncbi:MAG: MFS transporter [bacterium]|nr:MFS transporter [bacterium]
MKQKLKGNVFLLSMVSLFTDTSSHMIYPLLPEFLSSIGATKTIIGIIEGIAESIASLLRSVFGALSDKLNKRKEFVFWGYALSAITKPFLFIANSWLIVLFVRFSDRIGKAVRTPPRDAILSTSVDASKQGAAFGFNRAMDRMGAIWGPILAVMILAMFSDKGLGMRYVFLWSLLPAVIALIFIPFVKETGEFIKKQREMKYEGLKSARFILFIVAAIIFSLGNSSNSFLILKARDTGLTNIAMIPVLWIVYNISSSFFSIVLGKLSDKIGRARIVAFSFLFYGLLYVGFAFANKLYMIWILFFLYGVYYGLSEGIYRAYIAQIVEPDKRATAFGIFNTGIGIVLLPASIITGVVWDKFGSVWAFNLCALFSFLALIIFGVHLLMERRSRLLKNIESR